MVVYNEVVSILLDGLIFVFLLLCIDLLLYDFFCSFVFNLGIINSFFMFKLSNELVCCEISGGFIGDVLVVFFFLRFFCFWMLGFFCVVCLIVCLLLLLDKFLLFKESNIVILLFGFIIVLFIVCGFDNL